MTETHTLPPSPNRPDDDIIPLDTCITLIDADAAVIARRLGDVSWADRERFFNNIICESLDNLAKVMGVLELAPDQSREFVEAAFLGMHERIGEIVELWGAPAVTNDDMARVYALSAAPGHRVAVGDYCAKVKRKVDALFKPDTGLIWFFRFSTAFRPGMSLWWRDHHGEA